MQFLAILDDRTTDICRARNGKIMRLDSEELAANTPPLHYWCRSVLSPITRYDLQEMEKSGWKWSEPGIDGKPMTFQDLQNWKNLPELPPGFGNLSDKLTVGKLSKGLEGSKTVYEVSDEEIKQTKLKFDLLKEKYPDLINDIEVTALKQMANYVMTPFGSVDESYVWHTTKEGSVFSYTCYLHEYTELTEIEKVIANSKTIRTPEKALRKERVRTHEAALYEQYSFIKKYFKTKGMGDYDIIHLSLADVWDDNNRTEFDEKNTAHLREYLKLHKKLEYNENIHRPDRYYEADDNFETKDEKYAHLRKLKKILREFREKGE